MDRTQNQITELMARKYWPRRKKKRWIKRYGRDAFREYESMGRTLLRIRDTPPQTIQDAVAAAISIVNSAIRVRQISIRRARKKPLFEPGGVAAVDEISDSIVRLRVGDRVLTHHEVNLK